MEVLTYFYMAVYGIELHTSLRLMLEEVFSLNVCLQLNLKIYHPFLEEQPFPNMLENSLAEANITYNTTRCCKQPLTKYL